MGKMIYLTESQLSQMKTRNNVKVKARIEIIKEMIKQAQNDKQKYFAIDTKEHLEENALHWSAVAKLVKDNFETEVDSCSATNVIDNKKHLYRTFIVTLK